MTINNQEGASSGNTEASALLEELKRLLNNIYADMDVSRDRVSVIMSKARNLAENEEKWPGGQAASQDYLENVEGLGKKINQMLDLKKLKEEGLVRAVKL